MAAEDQDKKRATFGLFLACVVGPFSSPAIRLGASLATLQKKQRSFIDFYLELDHWVSSRATAAAAAATF